MAKSGSSKPPRQCPVVEEKEEAVKNSEAEEHQSAPRKPECVELPPSLQDGTSEGEQKSYTDDSGDEQMLSHEKEAEQGFLVNLYKFMKERHTPIERVPHLGFKQINLFKIYKVVEKLGAYELVTGKRLWKNVYDLLGGSPGSTSAATCTRRHYERLVLPYVRHLKGEGDKPLPPIIPRKQYKVSKEPKGDKVNGGTEKKRARKEKMSEQIHPEKLNPEVVLPDSKPANGIEQNRSLERIGKCLSHQNGQDRSESPASDGCRGNCRPRGSSETYKRLLSSFYCNGNHGIMSPLAKKKLLAQVSKDEAFYCQERHLSHCPEYKKSRIQDVSGLNSEAGIRLSSRCYKQAKDKAAVEREVAGGPMSSSQVSNSCGGTLKVSPNLKESHVLQRLEGETSGGHPTPDPPIFNSSFYSSRKDPTGCLGGHSVHGPVEYYPRLRDIPTPTSSYQQPGKNMQLNSLSQNQQDGSEDQPEDLRQKPSQLLSCWREENPRSSAFQSHRDKRGSIPFLRIKPSWVPPVTKLPKGSPQTPKSPGRSVPPGEVGSRGQKRRALDEEDFPVPGKKLKAVSPFVKEVETNGGVEGSPSPKAPQGLAKPKAALPDGGFSVVPTSQVHDVYKGMMVKLPVNFNNPGEHLKGHSPSLAPSLSISPFIIPAFPTPLITASVQTSDLCQPLGTNLVHYPTSYGSTLCHRLYPLSPWQSQPAYATPHIPAFHRNTKL